MRKIILRTVLCAVAALGAAGLRAQTQVKFGGFLAGEYLKGQTESAYARGTFGNLLAGATVSGVVSQKFAFALEARALGESDFRVEQAWVGFVPSAVVGIKAGLFLVPFGAWNQANRPQETLLIGTPLNIDYFYPESWRELGLLVDGKFGILSYAAYIGNGLKEADMFRDGQQFSDNNKNKAKGGRLAVSITQEVQAGLSYYTGKADDLDQRSLTLTGAHLSWVTDGWEVHGEATRGTIQNPEPFDDGKSEGYSAWLVMKFARIQPVGSYQKVKYTDPYHAGGIALDLDRWTAGVRLVLGPNVFVKGEYEWNRETPRVQDNLLRVQAVVSF
jgi:hypothetical protein